MYMKNQGGRRQRNIGGALCSDYDVMISMTSLLLQFLAKRLVRISLGSTQEWHIFCSGYTQELNIGMYTLLS